MWRMQRVILALFFLSVALRPVQLNAAMTGGDFEIYADSFSVITANEVTSTSFGLSGSSGGLVMASSTGGTFELRGGFEAEEIGILTASVSASSVTLQALATGAVSTSSLVLTVSTDSETGYTAAVSEDGNLRSGSNDIDDVTDGTVTAGSEEYGIRTTGNDGLLASDAAISGSVSVAAASGSVTNSSTTIQFRASMSSGTSSGSYSHSVVFTVTVNP